MAKGWVASSEPLQQLFAHTAVQAKPAPQHLCVFSSCARMCRRRPLGLRVTIPKAGSALKTMTRPVLGIVTRRPRGRRRHILMQDEKVTKVLVC